MQLYNPDQTESARTDISHAAFTMQQPPVITGPQQRPKRQAETEEFLIQEGKATNIGEVYRPPHMRQQQVYGNSNIFQPQIQSLELQQQNLFRFNEGTSQSTPSDRKRLRPLKRNRCDEKVKHMETLTNSTTTPRRTALETRKVLVQDIINPVGNTDMRIMEGTENTSQDNEQAAAPAFKAPRAQ